MESPMKAQKAKNIDRPRPRKINRAIAIDEIPQIHKSSDNGMFAPFRRSDSDPGTDTDTAAPKSNMGGTPSRDDLRKRKKLVERPARRSISYEAFETGVSDAVPPRASAVVAAAAAAAAAASAAASCSAPTKAGGEPAASIFKDKKCSTRNPFISTGPCYGEMSRYFMESSAEQAVFSKKRVGPIATTTDTQIRVELDGRGVIVEIYGSTTGQKAAASLISRETRFQLHPDPENMDKKVARGVRRDSMGEDSATKPSYARGRARIEQLNRAVGAQKRKAESSMPSGRTSSVSSDLESLDSTSRAQSVEPEYTAPDVSRNSRKTTPAYDDNHNVCGWDTPTTKMPFDMPTLEAIISSLENRIKNCKVARFPSPVRLPREPKIEPAEIQSSQSKEWTRTVTVCPKAGAQSLTITSRESSPAEYIPSIKTSLFQSRTSMEKLSESGDDDSSDDIPEEVILDDEFGSDLHSLAGDGKLRFAQSSPKEETRECHLIPPSIPPYPSVRNTSFHPIATSSPQEPSADQDDSFGSDISDYIFEPSEASKSLLLVPVIVPTGTFDRARAKSGNVPALPSRCVAKTTESRGYYRSKVPGHALRERDVTSGYREEVQLVRAPIHPFTLPHLVREIEAYEEGGSRSAKARRHRFFEEKQFIKYKLAKEENNKPIQNLPDKRDFILGLASSSLSRRKPADWDQLCERHPVVCRPEPDEFFDPQAFMRQREDDTMNRRAEIFVKTWLY